MTTRKINFRIIALAYGAGARLDGVYAEPNFPLLDQYTCEVQMVGAHLLGQDARTLPAHAGGGDSCTAAGPSPGPVRPGRVPAVDGTGLPEERAPSAGLPCGLQALAGPG